tara:strand:- start:244 stop:699 length:456 start_codon:yes stop_codon:yes gene_type:complete
MGNSKNIKYLGKKSKIPDSPDDVILDTVKNPHPDENYSIRFSSPEFTSICPITSQPDFGIIIIDYIPKKLIVESKSLKLFLFSFRDYGGFHEDCTLKIGKKILESTKPKWIRVTAFWNPRGGIPIDVFYQKGTIPKGVYINEPDIKPYTGR